MKTDHFDREDENLLQATRGLASRHTEVPPTPRDTIAVLRQAAEQQREQSATGLFAPFLRRFSVMAALLIIAAAGWWALRPDLSPTAPATTADAELPPASDLGLDLADWDLEFEAILSELDDSLTVLAGDYGELDLWARNLDHRETL